MKGCATILTAAAGLCALPSADSAYLGVVVETNFPQQEHVRPDANIADKMRYYPLDHLDDGLVPGKVRIGDLSDPDSGKDTSSFRLLDHGFEYFKFGADAAMPLLFEEVNLGLTGAEVGMKSDILDFKKADNDVIDFRVADAMQGFGKIPLPSAWFTYSIRCSGFGLRKTGPLKTGVSSRVENPC